MPNIRVKNENGDVVMTELTANRIKPRVLADYLARRMKPEMNPMAKLINIFDAEEGGDHDTL